ncbi:zinc-ribbon domain containing protein [Tundrisphaera sp. TA3]|uniref:zinc-ribbon domain containing protein n=1 Tax=Tundrisphaera sp. TA3 TaxID=3435775 RepID=UPI003EB749C3
MEQKMSDLGCDKRLRRLPELPDNLVPHPRFGVAYRPDVVVPADLTRQNFTAYPIPHYVDVLRQCRNCGRPFIFFALEQKHWFEDLHFHIHSSQCVRCTECRRRQHHLSERLRRYSRLVVRDDLSDSELESLVGEAAYLFGTGHHVGENRLRRIKNLALARIPDSLATKQILATIEGIIEIDGQRLTPVEAMMLRGILGLIDAGASVVKEAEAKATIIPADDLDRELIPSYADSFKTLLRRGFLTWGQDRYGTWGARPSPAAIEGLRGGSQDS